MLPKNLDLSPRKSLDDHSTFSLGYYAQVIMVNPQHRKPLEFSGALDKFKYEDTTPEIGREFLNVNIVDDLLNAQNADKALRDLAITSKLTLP